MSRECFARYLKLSRRALSDAAAIAAAAAAGISSGGAPLAPLEDLLQAADAAAAEEARGYGGGAGGASSALEESIAANWGTAGLLQGLYVVKNDLVCAEWLGAALNRCRSGQAATNSKLSPCCTCLREPQHALLSPAPLPPPRPQARLDSLLPELGPRDRGGELVEHTVRQHVSLCFAALERRLLATAEALAAALAAPAAARNGEAKQRLLQRGLAVLQSLLVGGLERLLRRWVGRAGGQRHAAIILPACARPAHQLQALHLLPTLRSRSLKEYERQAWVLTGWRDVFVSAVQGQVANLFLSLCQQLLAAARLQAPPSLSAAVVGSARSTVESAAPFAAVQRRRTATLTGDSSSGGSPGGGSPGEAGGSAGAAPPPAALLLLCQLCKYGEREAVGLALVLLQQLYPERLLAGGEELPAFQPTELGRQLAAAAGALLQGYVAAHGAELADAAAASSRETEWATAREPRAPRPVCDALLAKASGEQGAPSEELGGGGGPFAHRLLPTFAMAPAAGGCSLVSPHRPQRWTRRPPTFWSPPPLQRAAACRTCTRAPAAPPARRPGSRACRRCPRTLTRPAGQATRLTWRPLSPACCQLGAIGGCCWGRQARMGAWAVARDD